MLINANANTPTGKCQDRPCKYTAKLSSMSPENCLSPSSCHVICAKAGWCIHDNKSGKKGMLKPLYKGKDCVCPTGAILRVSSD